MAGIGTEGAGCTAGVAPGVPLGAISALLGELAHVPEERLDDWTAVLRPGVVVHRFELLREIGRGGFGVVFEARDRALGRLVAFKAILPGTRAAARIREEGLLHEAEAAAQLNHPNVCTLHDLGRGPAGPYLVLELLHGETLAQRLSRGPLPPERAVAIATEVARALAHAHASGVLHRDLKPSNVSLEASGTVKVLDFGLARVLGGRASEPSGTPAYMAPEQWRGESADERTDVFSLGVVLFEMLAGTRPFQVTLDGSTVLDPGPAPALPPERAPLAVSSLVARMLSKDPGDRPASGQALLEEMLRLRAGLAVAKEARRRAWLWTAAGAAAFTGLVLGFVGTARLRVADSRAGTRIAVAVADFANETGDPELDGLSGLLITSLEQSHRLSVMTRGRMAETLRRLGREKVDRIDEGLARDVGREARLGALLLASVRRFDALYSAELKALEPLEDRYLFALREEGRGKESIPGIVDRLSERARRALHEGASDIRASQVKVAEVTTPSLEAYRHYFLGLQCMDLLTPIGKECARELERAVEIDPAFALAHLQLAFARLWTFADPRARDAMGAALRHVDRAPPRERLWIRAFDAQLQGRWEEAGVLFREAVEASPEDRWLVSQAADFFLTTNDLAAALPYYRRSLELDPTYESHAPSDLAQVLGASGKRSEIRELVKRLEAAPPRLAVLEGLVWAHGWLGDGPAAIEAARRAVTAAAPQQLPEHRRRFYHVRTFFGDWKAEAEVRALPAQEGTNYDLRRVLSLLLASQGRQREAFAHIDAVVGSGPTWMKHYLRAEFLVGGGDPGPVWRDAQQAAEVEPVLSASLAVHLAYLGDLDHAAVLARRMPPGSPRDQVYRAVVQWKTGDRGAALERLAALTAQNPWSSEPHVLPPSFLQGELAAQMGEDARAVEALRLFQSLFVPGHVYRGWAYPRSLYLLARSHERLGERDKARSEIEKLLALWKKADRDLPLLAEAKALRKRLAGPPVPSKAKPRSIDAP